MKKGLFYALVIKDGLRYKTIQNSNSKETSIRFGVGSIINSILFIIFAAATAFAIKTLGESNANIGLGVLLLVFGIPGMLAASLNAVVKSIYQLRLNKKPIGYVALGIALVIVVCSVIVIALLSN